MQQQLPERKGPFSPQLSVGIYRAKVGGRLVGNGNFPTDYTPDDDRKRNRGEGEPGPGKQSKELSQPTYFLRWTGTFNSLPDIASKIRRFRNLWLPAS